MDKKQFFLRLAIVVAALFALAFIARRFPALLLFPLVAAMAYGAYRQFIAQAAQIGWVSKWSSLRTLRKMRKAYLASPMALFLYTGSIALGLTGFLTSQLPAVYISLPFFTLSGILLCVATIVDWYDRLKYVLVSKWAKRIVGAIFSFLGATTVIVSNIVANHLVHFIAQADAARMPEFVRAASAFIYPFALAVVVSLVLVIVTSFQFLGLFAGGIASSTLRASAMVVSNNQSAADHLMYRLINGKRPAKSRVWWQIFPSGLEVIGRPIGTGSLAVLAGLAASGIFMVAGAASAPYLQRALVMAEYHTPHLCENVRNDAAVAYQDDGYVSVALKNGAGYIFTQEKCHK
ncbi:hypothetical protein [Herbaspirillum rubrisubalbicans]|uniref:hypothetical protein n=1 Tax=Herbaspirillum rubrisubalbicans TaxID=80842 RepID=UPI0002FB6208|nr:hypothetical protein [Herbaspirillum rubrisubalbicans]